MIQHSTKKIVWHFLQLMVSIICSGIGQEMEDEAQGTMEDLVRWLWRTNVLNQKYDLLYSSCYNFGKAVSNHVAVNKRYA